MEKVCTICKTAKPLNDFSAQKGGRFGLRAACRECRLEEHRIYNLENARKISLKNSLRYQENKLTIDTTNRGYAIANAGRVKVLQAAWRKRNRAALTRANNVWARTRADKDPGFKALAVCRRRLLRALRGSAKAAPTGELLGCSSEFLRFWIELQFRPGMTWENHGKWHLDHKKPCASFDFSDSEQQKLCFHYSNLQPLWAAENIAKGAK